MHPEFQKFELLLFDTLRGGGVYALHQCVDPLHLRVCVLIKYFNMVSGLYLSNHFGRVFYLVLNHCAEVLKIKTILKYLIETYNHA